MIDLPRPHGPPKGTMSPEGLSELHGFSVAPLVSVRPSSSVRPPYSLSTRPKDVLHRLRSSTRLPPSQPWYRPSLRCMEQPVTQSS